jgi:hypothetical protein
LVHSPRFNGRPAGSRVLGTPWCKCVAGIVIIPAGTSKRASWRAARPKKPVWLAVSGLNPQFWALRSTDPYFTNPCKVLTACCYCHPTHSRILFLMSRNVWTLFRGRAVRQVGARHDGRKRVMQLEQRYLLRGFWCSQSRLDLCLDYILQIHKWSRKMM